MTTPLNVTIYRPTGLLARYVRAFQVLSTKEPARVSVLDFGGADVSVPLSFGDPVLVDGADLERVQSASLVGPRKRSVWLRFNGKIDQVNVSFFPGVAGAFVGFSMPEVVGCVVSPEDVWPLDFREGVAALAQCQPNSAFLASPTCCWRGSSLAGNPADRSVRRCD